MRYRMLIHHICRLEEYLAVFSPSSPVPQFVRAGKFAAIAYAQQTSSGTSPIIAIDIRDGLQIIHTTTETETATAPAEETVSNYAFCRCVMVMTHLLEMYPFLILNFDDRP
jgi:hypothetical protein